MNIIPCSLLDLPAELLHQCLASLPQCQLMQLRLVDRRFYAASTSLLLRDAREWYKAYKSHELTLKLLRYKEGPSSQLDLPLTFLWVKWVTSDRMHQEVMRVYLPMLIAKRVTSIKEVA